MAENTNFYNQKPRRKARFIPPSNSLKAKVGSGGLSDDILKKAQALLEENTVDFLPLGELYLTTLMRTIERASTYIESGDDQSDDPEDIIMAMLQPAMQLKANGGMFKYPLITKVGDRLVNFLEAVDSPNIDVIEIVMAFHTTIRAIIIGRISGEGGQYGQELYGALDDACIRYFKRYNEENENAQDIN
jgi:hypothetical protein